MLFSPNSPLNIPSRWLSRATFPLFDLYDQSDRLQELKRLLRTQYLSSDELEFMQLTSLKQILAYATKYVPYYRCYAQEHRSGTFSASSLSALREFPVLKKSGIREAGDALITTDASIKNALISSKTGGSTGTSLFLKTDHRTQQHCNAAAMRSDMWAGWRMGDWTGCLWGSPEYPRGLKQKIRNALRDRLVYLDTMRLDSSTMGEFLRLMQTRRIDSIFGHAHSLFILADYAVKERSTVPAPHAIVSTSMMLLASERARIEEAFGCAVTDRYGCEEVGLIASECEHHQGYHVCSEHVIVEIIDEQDEPCAPGEVGRVIVTGLNNRGMPLIRYEVGDLAAWAATPCPCGRGLPTLERIVGRQADCLKRANGSLVAGVSLVERTLLAISGIAQLQLVQEAPTSVVAHTVLAENALKDETSEALRGALCRDLGANIDINVQIVQRIPQEKNGKYRFAIRRFT